VYPAALSGSKEKHFPLSFPPTAKHRRRKVKERRKKTCEGIDKFRVNTKSFGRYLDSDVI